MKKNIRQHVCCISDKIQLLQLLEECNAFKTYIASRYNGINSITLLPKHRKLIRDNLIGSDVVKQSKLQGRHWKTCIDDVIGNVKTNWALCKNDIKFAISNNSNLADEDRHYLRYVLKDDVLFQSILQRKQVEIKKSFNVNFKYLNNLLRRYTYRYHRKASNYAHCKTITLDSCMYSCKDDCISIMGRVPRKPIILKTKENIKFSTTIKIVIYDDEHIEIHACIDTKVKNHSDYTNIIGIDKGYTCMLETSSDNSYGENLSELLSKETEVLCEINKKRNKIRQQIRDLESNGEYDKAEKIRANNFGMKKYVRNKNKHNEHIKSYINHSINEMLKNEKPKEIVLEDLTWSSKKKLPYKKVNRKLSSWCKGYIDERLNYKCLLNNVTLTYVNPAYTSQICNCCGIYGKRVGKIFTCSNCGTMDADRNASKNILARKYMKNITVYTSVVKVKSILKIT